MKTLEFYNFCMSDEIFDDYYYREMVCVFFDDQRLERFISFLYKKICEDDKLYIIDNKKRSEMIRRLKALTADYLVKKDVINKIEKIGKKTGIEIILLKSNALNEWLFLEGTFRSSSDIDILIREDDKSLFESEIIKIADKLVANSNNPFENLYEETWKINSNNQYLDVHYNIANPKLFSPDLKDVFLKSIMHPHFKSEFIKVMSKEHCLIHSCLHMYNDADFASHAMFDFLYIKNNFNLDRNKIIETAKKWECIKVYEFSEKKSRMAIKKENQSTIKLLTSRLGRRQSILLGHTRQKSIKRRIKQLVSLLLLIDKNRNKIKFLLVYIKEKVINSKRSYQNI